MSDTAAQLRQAIGQIERAILLLEPVQPGYQAHYERLLGLRDGLEGAFTAELTRRLRKGSPDFSGDIAELQKVTDDLEEKRRRLTRTREVVGYVAMAVELTAQVVARILSLLA